VTEGQLGSGSLGLLLNWWVKPGNRTEGEGSLQLTSTLRQVVL
jgi:hypothetical protein